MIFKQKDGEIKLYHGTCKMRREKYAVIIFRADCIPILIGIHKYSVVSLAWKQLKLDFSSRI
jgi:hypothetical protein